MKSITPVIYCQCFATVAAVAITERRSSNGFSSVAQQGFRSTNKRLMNGF